VHHAFGGRPVSGRLEGRCAVVTGASGGIGAAVARLLREEGAWVGMVARGRERLEAVARAVDGVAIAGDASDDAGVASIVERAARLAGRPADILVNSAGAFELAAVAETAPEQFRRMVGANLVGPFLMARALLPGMLEARRGHVVTIGSIAGRQAFPQNGAYSASKFGVRGLHAVLAAELRGTGVRATLVEPAATDTDLWDTIDVARHHGLPARSAMLPPEQVAEAVLYALTAPLEVAVHNIMVERA
jgi:NADP-dependent 3-hydroxy acid dehydrogenase YdfG